MREATTRPLGHQLRICCAGGLSLCLLGSVGCPFPGEQVAGFNPEDVGNLTLNLQSREFTNGAAIPVQFTAIGDGTSPQLNWSGVPAGTQEFAMIVTDLGRTASPFAQWMVYKIAPTVSELSEALPEGLLLSDPSGAVQGLNYNGQYGYLSPDPTGGVDRRIQFTLYALDVVLDVPAGLDRQGLLDAMQGHIIAETGLIGVVREQTSPFADLPFFGG